ncbi:hypothetical protein [Brucella suis]|uniref:hypothetical protein n=1 Tax=Brucella suis TaxID=29461 RepID=UPI0001BA0EDE|nr:hypothetical protein [Brucella suis]EEY28267.1 predicted protein [Brucella suis bv. 5 str. 513]
MNYNAFSVCFGLRRWLVIRENQAEKAVICLWSKRIGRAGCSLKTAFCTIFCCEVSEGEAMLYKPVRN